VGQAEMELLSCVAEVNQFKGFGVPKAQSIGPKMTKNDPFPFRDVNWRFIFA